MKHIFFIAILACSLRYCLGEVVLCVIIVMKYFNMGVEREGWCLGIFSFLNNLWELGTE
jgi:hypothetical protein